MNYPLTSFMMIVTLVFIFGACTQPKQQTAVSSSSIEIQGIEPTIPSNTTIKKAEPIGTAMCPDTPKILRSTSKFIKIEHAMSQFEEANKISVSWCEQFNFNSDFSTQKCDKCCESNFQCR